MFVPDEEVGSPSTPRADRGRGAAEPLRARARAGAGGRRRDHRPLGVPALRRPRPRPARRTPGRRSASGRSAIREIAEQIVAIEELSEPERNMTFSVGIVAGGQFVNVVPWICEAQVLAVSEDPDDFDRVRERMTGPRGAKRGDHARGRARSRPAALRSRRRRASSSTSTLARSPARSASTRRRGSSAAAATATSPARSGSRPWTGSAPRAPASTPQDEHVLIDSLIPRARLLSGLLRTLE